MRVLHQDTKTGEIKIQVDSLDDLWHLYNIVSEGDIVSAVTFRREETKADKIRAERGTKKKMRLGIRVEKLDFHEFEDRLRILGVIEQGPQDLGSHHTFNVREGDTLTIIKDEWGKPQLDRIRRAVEDAAEPRMLFVSLDTEEATLAVLRQFGLKELANIQAPSSGKMYENQGEGGYEEEILKKIELSAEQGVPIVILGPGFAKESLMAMGKDQYPDLFENAHLFHTGQSGMPGIHELMKKGMGAEVLEYSRMAKEVSLVETVLQRIAQDGLVAYGPDQVERAAQMGAVETLLILDSLVRDRDMDELMRLVEETRGKVVVVSEHHDAGENLEALGGLAALLRFRVE